MTDKPKFERAKALAVANELIERLRPACERIEIAGSLRRGKSYVGDIELVFIPRSRHVAYDMFTTKDEDLAATAIDKMVADGLLVKRHNSAGHIAAWGPLNKLARHLPSGIPVDFFSTTAENWAVSLVIRTGSKETNLRLTTGANRLNRTLHAYGSGITDRKTGKDFPANSERAVFALCGIPYLEPQAR